MPIIKKLVKIQSSYFVCIPKDFIDCFNRDHKTVTKEVRISETEHGGLLLYLMMGSESEEVKPKVHVEYVSHPETKQTGVKLIDDEEVKNECMKAN